MKNLFPIVIGILALAAGLYFVFDRHEKCILKMEMKDSIYTLKMDIKIAKQDSVQSILLKHDSIQSKNETKLEHNYKVTSKNLDAVRDSMGFLPDL